MIVSINVFCGATCPFLTGMAVNYHMLKFTGAMSIKFCWPNMKAEIWKIIIPGRVSK